jgi:LytS/YehU family sensor histidine kinase
MHTVSLAGALPATLPGTATGWPLDADHAQLRLSQLQGQLEPHFVFNALNSISALVRANDPPRALKAIANMAGMMRHTLKAGAGEWISVQDELNFVRGYLELQRLRFGDAFEVDWQVAAGPWDSCACPPLLFQPLVENAFHHCVEVSGRFECIRLRLDCTDDGRLLLAVHNRLPSVSACVLSNAGFGLGLSGTRERLALLYGDQAGLSAQANADGEFTVALTLPLRSLDEPLESPGC